MTTVATATSAFIRELMLGRILAATGVDDATEAYVEAQPEEAICT